ncbi:FAD-dependent monooxygenase, partial [Rhizobium sp. SIMBA_035]
MQPILEGWIHDLGVPAHRGTEVVGFVQDQAGVDVELAEGASLRARFLIGADGGRSV